MLKNNNSFTNSNLSLYNLYNMKKIQFSLILFLLTAFIFSACLDEITLPNPIDLEESVAIQGSLIKGDPSRVDVFVSRLSNLTGVNLPKAILDADVFIINEEGTELLLDNINSGYYELEIPANNSNFNVEVNKQYQLKVVANGNTYISSLEMMLPVPQISSLGVNLVDREVINQAGVVVVKNNIEFYVNTPLVTPGTNDKTRMIWQLEGTYKLSDTPAESCRPTSNDPLDPKICYLTDKINLDKVVVLDGTKLNANDLVEYPIYEGGINFRFSEGYYMTFFQRSLTSGAFKYWEDTNEMLQRTGSIFEAPAGKIESNFTNPDNPEEEIFGYFYASQEDTSRIFIDPVSVDFPATNCPIFYDPLSGEGHCCDCLKLEGSTTLKPSFWQ